MSLNIKSAEAHQLATQLASITGESMARAVTNAIREKLARVQNSDAVVMEILEIGRDCASRLKTPSLSLSHGELLYDEYGLPK